MSRTDIDGSKLSAAMREELDRTRKAIEKQNSDLDAKRKKDENDKLISKEIQTMINELQQACYTPMDKDGKQQHLMDRFLQQAEHARSTETTAYNSGWDNCIRSVVGSMSNFSEALSPTVAYHTAKLFSVPLSLVYNGLTKVSDLVDLFSKDEPLRVPELSYKLKVENGRLDVELTPKDPFVLEHEDQWKAYFKAAVGVLLTSKNDRSNRYTETNGVWSHNRDHLTQEEMDALREELNALINIPSFEPKPCDAPRPMR